MNSFPSMFTASLLPYINGSGLQCFNCQAAIDVLKSLTEWFKVDVHRDIVDSSTLSTLAEVVQKFRMEVENGENYVDTLNMIFQCFRCLRNCCVSCRKNQEWVVQNSTLLPDAVTLSTTLKNLDEKNSSATVVDNTVTCRRCIVQFLGNAVTGYDIGQQNVWDLLYDHLLTLLNVEDAVLADYTTMVLYSCLNADRRLQLLTTPLGIQALESVLRIAAHPNTEWSLFIVESFLQTCSDFLGTLFKHIPNKERSFLLDIVHVVLENSDSCDELGNVIDSSNVLYIATEFIENGHQIIGLDSSPEEENMDPTVVVKILEILCTASCHKLYQQKLQELPDLLTVTVGLLQAIHYAGQSADNQFSNVSKASQLDKVDTGHPLFGLKRNLIRLIGNLVYKHRTNQDMVRDLRGINLVLDHTNIDGRNPFITQWAVFTVHNLCEGNPANQAVIAGLNMEGVANAPQLLDEFGIQAEVRDKQVKIQKAD